MSESNQHRQKKEIKVLITGYGPFQSIVDNPSWLAVKDLHDCIQVAVHYGTILDLIPRLHSQTEPVSSSSTDTQAWFDDRCDSTGLAGTAGKSYPDGYRIDHPVDGYDVIIHVGVGLKGGIECEVQANKTGYNLPDANNQLAPVIATPLPDCSCPPTELNHTDGKTIDAKYLSKDGKLRGFGKGYEPFELVEKTNVDVAQLVSWLKDAGMQDQVKPSLDAGRYLCDFIYYCSLSEAKRANNKTDVLFIHVPPVDQDLSTETCTDALRCIAWYCARQRAKTYVCT